MTSDTLISGASVGRLLRPRSIAVVGVSEDPGSMGGRTLANLTHFGFDNVHLVSRTNKSVFGRPCVASIDDLPEGVDAAVIALPRGGVLSAIEACARKKVGGVVLFAAGFGEAGETGRMEQARIAQIARAADMAVLGPNTLGMVNFVDSIPLAFGPNESDPPAGRSAIAILAQSGAMMGLVRLSAGVRRYAVSYAIATGNEATVGIEDFLEHLVTDVHSTAIAIFAEQIRRPKDFLRLCAAARSNGKPVILLHPGRSEAARASAASHTGAMTGDYDVMRALVAAEGVVAVDTLEEFLDVAEFLTRFPAPMSSGPAVMTDSGAMRGLALDFAQSHGLDIPALSPETRQYLSTRLPEFAAASNPLDITAQGLKDLPLYAETAEAMAGDTNAGGILVAVMPGVPSVGLAKANAILPVLAGSDKPRAYVMLGDAPLDPSLPARAYADGMPFYRSPERALRTFAHALRCARLRAEASLERPHVASDSRLDLPSGIVVEYRGKDFVKAAGIAIPRGRLARDVDEAVDHADDIGWPVVLKIQAAALPHKTDIGGVQIGLADADAVRSAWSRMTATVAERRPDVCIDGCLVEAMAESGLEAFVGGRRDPQWGPVLLFGLGGIWIEVLHDVRLIAADSPRRRVLEEIDRLQARGLLDGSRGRAAVDKEGFADAICAVGALLRRYRDIQEIDINPLVLYPRSPPLALDTMIVTR